MAGCVLPVTWPLPSDMVPQPVSPSLLWPLTTARHFPPHNHHPGYFLFQVTSASFLPNSDAHFFRSAGLHVYMHRGCYHVIGWLAVCVNKIKINQPDEVARLWFEEKNHKRKQMNDKYKDKFLGGFFQGETKTAKSFLLFSCSLIVLFCHWSPKHWDNGSTCEGTIVPMHQYSTYTGTERPHLSIVTVY